MRKKIHALFLLLVIFVAGIVLSIVFQKTVSISNKKTTIESNQSQFHDKRRKSPQSNSIFVPYWAVGGGLDVSDYDRVIYFGITPDYQGINKDEEGYQNLGGFVSAVGDRAKLLTVRMTNSSIVLQTLESKELQQNIIKDSIQSAKENRFLGIILDLEVSSLFDDSISQKVTDFVTEFSKQTHKDGLYFALTMYGDVFYRKRPFDVEALGKQVDEMMIMAYDFHKSIGEPGPNFPLNGSEKYGYDYQRMISDFGSRVPTDKLTVIFGMYGYDWVVDEKKRPIKQAKALSAVDIKKQYLQNCTEKNCIQLRDDKSKESEIDFVDSVSSEASQFAQNHIIWYEDAESVAKKREFLNSKGIGSVAYWAYGYF